MNASRWCNPVGRTLRVDIYSRERASKVTFTSRTVPLMVSSNSGSVRLYMRLIYAAIRGSLLYCSNYYLLLLPLLLPRFSTRTPTRGRKKLVEASSS